MQSNNTTANTPAHMGSTAELGRCRSCKHWEAYQNDEHLVLRGAGICHAAKELWESSESEEDPNDEWLEYRKLKPEAAGVLSFVQDASNYMAKLVTMPDFGCVQHEAP